MAWCIDALMDACRCIDGPRRYRRRPAHGAGGAKPGGEVVVAESVALAGVRAEAGHHHGRDHPAPRPLDEGKLLHMDVALRPWREDDRAAFAAMNADPHVMRHFLMPMTRPDADAFLDRIMAREAEHGFSMRCIEVDGTVAGLCGLARVSWDAPFTPAVEIGWRVLPNHEGKGIARRAAEMAFQDAFTRLALPRVVAFTVPANMRSLALMGRLGMRRGGAFDHPHLMGTHLRGHVWCEIGREDWLRRAERGPPG